MIFILERLFAFLVLAVLILGSIWAIIFFIKKLARDLRGGNSSQQPPDQPKQGDSPPVTPTAKGRRDKK